MAARPCSAKKDILCKHVTWDTLSSLYTPDDPTTVLRRAGHYWDSVVSGGPVCSAWHGLSPFTAAIGDMHLVRCNLRIQHSPVRSTAAGSRGGHVLATPRPPSDPPGVMLARFRTSPRPSEPRPAEVASTDPKRNGHL
ncbi:unnamed protein product [Pleuronectes platessa]|uniref:Uncharacterized protein n=1 Tax=Pleuronectes platessa TaxID=8262 RepID=A0A9N7UV22_PLEPL|nr:unnamed protein product [Pleuronectes platessa]